MHSPRGKYLMLLAVLLGAIFVVTAVAGCSALRRPAPPSQAPPGAKQALPNDPREASKLADRLATRAAKAPGVNSATVVLSGTTAFVGLNLDAEMEGERTEEVKEKVATDLRKAEPRIKRVVVTNDTDLVKRLEKVAEGVQQGKPVSSFSRELGEINRRSTPAKD